MLLFQAFDLGWGLGRLEPNRIGAMMVHTERALGCVYEAVPCLPVRYHQIVEMGIVNALTSQHFIAKWQERLPHSACPEANWIFIPSGIDLPPIGNPITPGLQQGTDDSTCQSRNGAYPPRAHGRIIASAKTLIGHPHSRHTTDTETQRNPERAQTSRILRSGQLPPRYRPFSTWPKRRACHWLT